MENYKKYIRKTRAIISIVLLSTALLHLPVKASVEVPQITSGMYFQMGKYNNNPIVWKSIVSDDENGILMLSDKILCYKNFDPALEKPGDEDNYYGTSFWENATLRTWLNSSDSSGNVVWEHRVPSNEAVHRYFRLKSGINPYSEEAGFLSTQNFKESEKSAMKTVSHWQALSEKKKYLTTNGLNVPFYPFVVKAPNTQFEQTMYVYKIPELKTAYYGAMYRLNDTIFTMDELQLYELWSQFGTVAAENADGVLDPWHDVVEPLGSSPNGIYWLRTPRSGGSITVASGIENYGSSGVGDEELGVRPAFYLNEENMVIQSGSGTAEDPYVLDGKGQDGIAVFCNSRQVEFDQQPIEENDRVLVPVRAIFEQLGAEVNYDDGDGVITANNGERTVVMQLDNPEMGNGTEVFTLDVPPKLVGDRTLVPLRAVSEAFDCKVEWIESLNRAVIDPPQPEDSDEGHWQSEWDIRINGKGKK